MKKFSCAAFLFALALVILTACGNGANERAGTGDADTGRALRVVTTIFPEYDWVRQILGDKANDADLTLLLDNGVDLHSYQPTVEDMVKISSCDLFIYVGGESDEWVKDALSEAVNQDMTVINLLDALGDAAKEEEVVEGMQESEHGDEEGEEAEYDEHVWLSLKNARILCGVIADALIALSPDDAQTFADNLNAYQARLDELDAQYQSAVSEAPVKTLLFGDRFPFRYLTDDYGLNYYAAFVGCSAETEASFETVVFLANKVDELNLSSVLTIENSDGKIARTIVENTAAKSAQILRMDSMQSATSGDVSNGATYLGVMERNLEVLRDALKLRKEGGTP